jgi:hypothetical protein
MVLGVAVVEVDFPLHPMFLSRQERIRLPLVQEHPVNLHLQ